MRIGTYYYPEQWPREQWGRDFDTMAALGLQIVHMGEFAWFSMEPAEGRFEFDWLAECVDLAVKHKMGVILCTPTAAPPIWLVQRHPEVLPVDDAGRRKRFGGRRHYSPTAPAYVEASRRIVTALADRFAGHPAVVGWQIDNEYSSDFIDQNDHAVRAWREWLGRKYGTVEALNKAWGCQFWNTYYTDFEQVLLPADRDPRYGNPHQVLDASRFWSWAFAQFNRVQAEIIAERVGSRQSAVGGGGQNVGPSAPSAAQDSGVGTQDSPFITTNFMSLHLDVNPGDMAGDLTLMAWDSYPCPGQEKSSVDPCFRIGDPAQIGFMHDYMASLCRRWGLMELQPGQVNWGNVPVHLHPGAVRLWLWTAFAHGAEFATTYRFRQPLFGIELFHHGLVGPDGHTPTMGGREFQQTLDEIARLDLAHLPPLARDAAALPAGKTVGMVFDFEQLWWFKILPQARRWDYARLVRLWYGALMRLGLTVRILRPGEAYPADLPLVVAPGLQMVDDAAVEHMAAYAKAGGHLVLTCRSALMDRTGQLFDGPLGKPILPLIGGAIEAYDGLPEDSYGQVDLDGKRFTWGVWGDLLYSEPDTRILAKYADQFYEGGAAVIQNKVEKGVVTYCGVFGEEAFTDALAERLAAQAKLAVQPLPARVQLLRRGPYRVLLNYNVVTVDAPAPPRTRFLVGARKVEPAGVAVWKEA